VNDLEFPSVVLRRRGRGRGIELRAIPHGEWVITPERIAAAVDGHTRIVALRTSLSHGRASIWRRSPRRRGSRLDTLIVVDATTAGVVPVPARLRYRRLRLLGSHGVAAFYWNRARRPDLAPAGIGLSVVDDLHPLRPEAGRGRFELGAEPRPYGRVSLDLLLRSASNAPDAVLALGPAIDGLRELDLPLMTPADPKQRAGIVSWLDPDPAATTARLEEQGVLVTGSAGRVRAGMHLYNSLGDVERLVAGMSALQW
jgi:selenocysteine lyase/cysteine desulfurase